MHHDASREVHQTPLCQEAASPYPMDERHIHEQAPEHQELQIALEVDPVGESARDEGRCDDSEHLLEEEVCQERDRGAVARIWAEANAPQADEAEVTYQPEVILAEGETEAH